jgi:hypothetical protein
MEVVNKIQHYEALILSLLKERADPRSDESYQEIIIADKETRHYQLLATGWTDSKHFLKTDGKIWLLENDTAMRPAVELVNLGVPKSDIVLGFHPPQYREFSGFATA